MKLAFKLTKKVPHIKRYFAFTRASKTIEQKFLTLYCFIISALSAGRFIGRCNPLVAEKAYPFLSLPVYNRFYFWKKNTFAFFSYNLHYGLAKFVYVYNGWFRVSHHFTNSVFMITTSEFVKCNGNFFLVIWQILRYHVE